MFNEITPLRGVISRAKIHENYIPLTMLTHYIIGRIRNEITLLQSILERGQTQPTGTHKGAFVHMPRPNLSAAWRKVNLFRLWKVAAQSYDGRI
jgi:hypothetical protein